MTKGHHGVALFFVLSGFLITYLLLNEAKHNGKINVKGFFMRRLLRIWPVYFIVIIFGFFLFPILPFGDTTSNSLLHCSLFISNFEEIWNGWRDSISFLSVTWSVSVEEQFYIGWVALMAILPRFRKGKFFLLYFCLLILTNLVFRTLYAGEERIIYFHTFSVVSDLAIGGFLSYACFHYKIKERIKDISRLKITLVYISGILITIFSSHIFLGKLVIIERIILGLFFAFIIFEQAYCTHSFYKADKIKGFFKLGELSYGFYMYHCIVIYYVQQIILKLEWQNSPIGFIVFILTALLLTIVISSISYRLVEAPLLKLKKKFR